MLLHTQGLYAFTHSNQLTNQKCRDFEAVVEQVFALLEDKTHTHQTEHGQEGELKGSFDVVL